MLGRGYEYMDLDDGSSAGEDLVGAATASATGGAPQGFAGIATKTGAGPAGLAMLADDAFDGSPRMPMIPSTWSGASPTQQETSDGGTV